MSSGKFVVFSQYLNDLVREYNGTIKIYPSKFVLINASEYYEDMSDAMDNIRENASYATDSVLTAEQKEYFFIRQAGLDQNLLQNYNVGTGDINFLSHNVYEGWTYSEIQIYVSNSVCLAENKEKIIDEPFSDLSENDNSDEDDDIDPAETIFAQNTDITEDDDSVSFNQIVIFYNIYTIDETSITDSEVLLCADMPLGVYYILDESESLTTATVYNTAEGSSGGTSWSVRLCSRFALGTDTSLTDAGSDYDTLTISISSFNDIIDTMESIASQKKTFIENIETSLDELRDFRTINVPYVKNNSWYVNGHLISDTLSESEIDSFRELLESFENIDINSITNTLGEIADLEDSINNLTYLKENVSDIDLNDIVTAENILGDGSVSISVKSTGELPIVTISVPYAFTSIAIDDTTIEASADSTTINLVSSETIEASVSDNIITFNISEEAIEELTSLNLTGEGIITVYDNIVSGYAFDTIYINSLDTSIEATGSDGENSLTSVMFKSDTEYITLNKYTYTVNDTTYAGISFDLSESAINNIERTFTGDDAVTVTTKSASESDSGYQNIIISAPFAFTTIKYTDNDNSSNNSEIIASENNTTITISGNIVSVDSSTIDLTAIEIPIEGNDVSGDIQEFGINDAIDTYFDMDNYEIFSVFSITSEYGTRYVWWCGADAATEIYNVNGGFFQVPNGWDPSNKVIWSIDTTDFSEYSTDEYEFTIFYYEEKNFFMLRLTYYYHGEAQYKYYMNWENIPEDADDDDGYLRDSKYFNTFTINSDDGTIETITANTYILFHDGYFVYQWNGKTFESVSYLSIEGASRHAAMPEESHIEFTYKFSGEDVWED